ncbi:MAG: TolB family protein [Fimbriimonas sp.]
MAGAILALCATATNGAAQKGSSGGSTTGGGAPIQKIYSHENNASVRTTFSMNTDGTAKTALASYGTGSGLFGDVTASYAKHNSKRWFVQSVKPNYYDLNQMDTQVRFFSDTGQTRVVDLDYGTVDPVASGGLIWAPGDQELTFVSRRIEGAVWSENFAQLLAGTVTEVGIFAAQVLYDAAGEPAGISTPYLKVATPVLNDGGDQYGDSSSVYDYDWSPDATALVCSGNLSGTLYGGGGSLFIIDSAGVRTLRTSGSYQPAWAPGSVNRIAYIESLTAGNSQLCSIGIDGSGRRVVVTPKITGGTTRATSWPQWSPDAASIAYQFSDPTKAGLYKVAASGSGNTKIGGSGTPVAWK